MIIMIRTNKRLINDTCYITKNIKYYVFHYPQDGKIFTSARLLRTGEEVIMNTTDDDGDKE